MSLSVEPGLAADAVATLQRIFRRGHRGHEHVRHVVAAGDSIYWSDAAGLWKAATHGGRIDKLAAGDIHQFSVNDGHDVVFSDGDGDLRRLAPDGTSTLIRKAAILDKRDNGSQLLFGGDLVYWTETNARDPTGDGPRDAIWATRLDGTGSPWRAADVDTLGGVCVSRSRIAWVESSGRGTKFDKHFISPSFRTAHFVVAEPDGSNRHELATIEHANVYDSVMTSDGLVAIVESVDGDSVVRASLPSGPPVTLARSNDFPDDLLTVGDREIYFIGLRGDVESVPREDAH